MYRGALLAGLILAGLNPANAQPSPQSPFAQIAKYPLTLYIARGDNNACGSGCNEWIAADGNFDRDAPLRFRDFLRKTGAYKLPVFFHSPGGLTLHAQLIGRQMREHGMTAGVARTFPDACVGADGFACDALKASGEKLRAEWSAIGAQCSSACVFALIGARERHVPLGSSLAVHASRTACLRGGTIMDPNLPWCRNMVAANKAKLLEYVRQMGIDPALIEFADEVPHEGVRVLSREEIVRFGIDRAALPDNRRFEQEYKPVGQNTPWTDGLKFVTPR